MTTSTRQQEELALKRQIRHVRDALQAEFGGLITMDDAAPPGAKPPIAAFLSRALAAKAVRILTGCSSEEAAGAVIDGRDDYGIDAVAFSDDLPELWLVQAKWKDKGTAGFDTEAANKLVRGFRQMDEQSFGRFNDRFQVKADRVKDVLADPRCQVRLVIALMGPGDLSAEVKEILDDADRDFSVLGRALSSKVLTGQHFHQAIKDDISPEPIKLTATMGGGWHSVDLPYQAYYGLVSASELAGWHQQHGDRLFQNNLRTALGRTGVNDQLVRSLKQNPEHFWYFHNGITVLCDDADLHFLGRRAKGEPVKLELENASVVNGAQSVTAAHLAALQGPELLENAYMSVRIITVKDTPDGFGREITTNTNTQNRIEQRDYVSLDPVQAAIREDFRLSLGKEYVLKRGELEPSPDVGCSVAEAAVALACAHHNPMLALRAKRSVNLLWEEGQGGTYGLLFGQQPSADEIWRSVRLLRSTRETVYRRRNSLMPRAAAIAEGADLLMVHLVFQVLGREGIDDPESSWDDLLRTVPETTEKLLPLLIDAFTKKFGSKAFVSAMFDNEDRCAQVVAEVLASYRGGATSASLDNWLQPRRPRPKRRPNSVTLIIDAEHIADGTRVEFLTGGDTEESAMRSWLSEDPRRGFATWVNNRAKPLLWEADGGRYSPSGLITHMWQLAEWKEAWVSVQGPRQWALPGEGNLADIAERFWRESQETVDAD